MRTLYIFTTAILLMVGVQTALAFEAVLEEVLVNYDVVTIQNPETEQVILGELADAPEMFEIVSETPFTLSAEIRAVPDAQRENIPEFNGIIIKQKEIRGVEEIARLNALESSWSVETDASTGLAYQSGPYFSERVEPGTYRIEISSPNNQGKYMLVVGSIADENGYFASLSDVKLTYQFYGLSVLRMFSSPYVHYPIGILVLLGLIAGTWCWQNSLKRHD